MIGRSIETNRLRNLEGLFLLEIEARGSADLAGRAGRDPHAGDVLVFSGEVARVQTPQRFPGLEVFGAGADALLKSNLVEGGAGEQLGPGQPHLREVDSAPCSMPGWSASAAATGA